MGPSFAAATRGALQGHVTEARTWLEIKRRWAHIGAMDDKPARKIDQLVSDARIELKRLGIETKGKRSDELLNMAREQRNKLRVAQLKLH